MKKGVYIISETACLNPNTGAGKHIEVGIRELNKHFNIEQLLFCRPYHAVTPVSVKRRQGGRTVRNKLGRIVKGWYLLIKNHLPFFRYYRRIKKSDPDFIYERSSYLNYNGLIISKLLGIPHVYEVNGITARDNAQYFSSYWNWIALKLEKAAYKKTYGFYVGGINEELSIDPANAMIIQNGIDQEFCKLFEEREIDSEGTINIAFIGHAMRHHRLDVLADALGRLKVPSRFTLHMVGSNLDEWKDIIPSTINTTYYGSQPEKAISEIITQFHVGIITYAESYFSHVKVFMYGAAGLTIILPESKNFKTIFSDDEVLFVKNADANEIADKLNLLEQQPGLLKKYGRNISRKVSRQYTWQRIYGHVAARIDGILSGKTINQAHRYDGSSYTS